MRNINLGFLRSQKRARRPLVLAGLLFVVLGTLMLTAVLFRKLEAPKSQFAGERIRLPITSVEKEEEPRVPEVVEKEAMEDRPLEGGRLGEEKPIVSEPGEPSTDTQESGVGKKVFILGEPEAPKEEKEVTGAEGERKRPEIEEKEEGKAQVAMAEEPKGPARAEGKPPTGGYTLNIASFRDKGNADRLMKELEQKGYEAFVETANIPQRGTWHRVAVGHFPSREEALAFAKGLQEEGIDYSFVRKLD
jgi:cell division septation protein DedD